MPYNGSGVYSVPISFVQDAANGIKILASRQDTQWADMVGAFNNCLTRDAQGKPTAAFDFNTFKGINLVNGVNPQDAVAFNQLGPPLSEWVAETGSVAFVANNQFKIVGVDKTATYHVGRRVRVTHNSGGSTAYATITATAFGTDTTVTLDISSLVSTVTAVAYGLLSYVNQSYLEPRSAVQVIRSTTQAYTASSAAKIQFNSVTRDSLGEYDNVTNFRFTPKFAGDYIVMGQIGCNGTINNNTLIIAKSGSNYVGSYAPIAGSNAVVTVAAVVNMALGDFIEMFFQANTNQTLLNVSGGITASWVSIARIP